MRTPKIRIQPLRFKIQGFRHLIISAFGNQEKGNDNRELRGGTTMLISGPPGVGKTTFALSLMRSLMLGPDDDPPRKPESASIPKKAPLAGTQEAPDAVSPGASKRDEYILYFISSEVSIDRLKEMFEPMGWLTDEHDTVFSIGRPEPDTDNFYVIVPEPSVDRPVPTPEELVNSVFNRIDKSLAPSEARNEGKKFLVIVDSITALLKGCQTESDQRRQTHEMLYRLRSMFGKDRLALTILLAEQDATDAGDAQTTPAVEDYLAEIVFRLSNKSLPLGRRLRTLEIVKSQGVNMIPGDHSWAIITKHNFTEYFRHPQFQELMCWKAKHNPKHVLEDGKDWLWSTIAIFPRPRLLFATPKIKESGTDKEQEAELSTGTKGLDSMLTGGHGEYWLATTLKRGGSLAKEDKPLRRGSTTLIAGPLGAGKTSLCMQFLLRDAIEKHFPEPDAPPSTSGDNRRKNLYFCLGSDAHETVRVAWERLIVKHPSALPDAAVPTSYKDDLSVLDFFQSQFDFNHLMAHLYWAIKEFQPNRIVFDGLSEWLTLYSRAEAAKMLEAVGALISHHPNYREDSRSEKVPRPAVFMTYDLPMTSDPLAPQNLGVVAGNIIAVKQISIKDEIRRVIYILKSDTTQHDQNVRELRADKRGVIGVHTGLDTFNGLLVGPIESAEVLLQLFRENYPQRCFNQWLVHRLSRLSNLRFKTLDFSRSEIGRTLEYTDSSTRFPPADLKILSVDEWCLSTEIAEPADDGQGSAKGTLAPSSSLLDLKPMWSAETDPQKLAASWQDFWVFDLEKAGPDNGAKSIYAVPGYMDFGMFCINAQLLLHSAALRRAVLGAELSELSGEWKQELSECYPHDPGLLEARHHTAGETSTRVFDNKHKTTIEKVWRCALSNLPRYLVGMDGSGSGSWFNRVPGSDKPETIVDLMLQRREEDGNIREARGSNPRNISDGQWGFAFDMATRETCVCVFFELAWGFGATEDLLKEDRWQANEQASVNAIKFLQFLVLEKLMPACPTVETTRRSLFSHHFYSTLRSVSDLDRWDVLGHKDEENQHERYDHRRVDEHPVSPPMPTAYAPPRLVALPIFPSGSRQVGLRPFVRDIQTRLDFIAKRFERCVGSDCCALGAKIREAAMPTTANNATGSALEAALRADIKKLVDGTNELIAAVKSPKFGEPAKANPPGSEEVRTGPTPEFADLLELVHWHMLRMNLLLAEDGGGGKLKEILTANTRGLASLPAATADAGKRFVPTGFGCSGSWMYGVHKVTRSASLASDLLQEITSLDAAEERARRGAGLPARRQFFDLHGHEQVPGMEYFNWRELLRFCGCRSRRRERALPAAGAPAAEIFQQIHRELQACLEYAKLRRDDYWNDSSRAAVIADVCRTAEVAFQRIVKTAHRSAFNPARSQ